ncbi:ABC transporter permease [Rhabdothermincola salaria]|uniref:ABC transporter permease n=1 Tax=Rhabdothermincola salaria TaxID=2903142 RepID=UPI001E533A17|nr:ABC transporter permease [Rhabdothermincola salaria]MCD9623018.1 ABC transporter permease [Rhabdothermincola salaria]
MRFVRKKLIQLVVVLLAVTFLSFLMLNLLPGDTAERLCAGAGGDECVVQKREELGLDKPIPVRYAEWLGNALTGDLGTSARNQQPVWEAITQRLPVTIELLVYSQFLALVVAVPMGLLAAQRSGGLFDRLSTSALFALLSVPNFMLALVLILVFAVRLQWFPAVGYTPFTENPLENLRSFFLPALTLAVAEMAVYMRLLRTDLIATLQEDYITMAKAKGMPSRRVLLRHAFRPSTFSLVTVIGLNFGRLIGGTLIVEVIFALNGLGKYTVDGILGQDYIPVQGAVVVIATGYVLINFAVDMFYAVLDPRIRHARALA